MTALTAPRSLGTTGWEISRITVGAAGWQRRDDGTGPTPEETSALAREIFTHPWIRALDTSNNYGAGQSERRVGVALDDAGGIPAGLVLSTKADRHSVTGDFSGERMRRSLEESMARLGIDRFPLLFLHDPENTTWSAATADDGPVAALVQARDEGLIAHLGISGGNCRMLEEFVRLGEFEAVITHNRYTLVDRSARSLLDTAQAAGVGVFNAAPYGGGLLTAYPFWTSRYAYGEAEPALLRAATAFGEIAVRHGVDLGAIALQFSLRDPRISSTIVGMRTREDLRRTEALVDVLIPEEVWDEVAAVPLDPATWQDALIPWTKR